MQPPLADAAAAADSGEDGKLRFVVKKSNSKKTHARPNEKFSTNVSGDTAAQANTEAKKDDDGPEQVFEKALLVGDRCCCSFGPS